jgi:formylglycine-generating enzyme required for sulfatase activity
MNYKKPYRFFLIGILAACFLGCQAQQDKEQPSQRSASTSSEAANQLSDSRDDGSNQSTTPKDSVVNGMAWIPPGTFQMGSRDFPDAQPVHKVELTSGFWMDVTEITNKEFRTFVDKTGYKTIAERPLDPADFPGVPEEKLVSGSVVFDPPDRKVNLNNPLQWWSYIEDASWKHPEGPEKEGDIEPDQPVVQVSFKDAKAYCEWVGERLPTEAEWEYAAKGGNDFPDYYWGDEKKPDDKWAANIYQGSFPDKNTEEDGYKVTAPVKSYPANSYGLYDMEGNVWEWVSDYYRPDYYTSGTMVDPKGPSSSYDPMEPNAVKRVQKGGSFLCSDQYCRRYLAGSRGSGEINSGSNNLGFRCVAESR